MSYEPSKYQSNNENDVANRGLYDARSSFNLFNSPAVISSTPHLYEHVNYIGRPQIRAQNIYINPNSLSSSRSVYINKNKLSLHQNTQSIASYVDPRLNVPISDSNIHYNPKFLKCAQSSSCVNSFNPENNKTIHINPSFTRNNDFRNLNSVSFNSDFKAKYFNGSEINTVSENPSKNSDRIFINPKFVDNHRESIVNNYSENISEICSTHGSLISDDFVINARMQSQNEHAQTSFNSTYCKINSVTSNLSKTNSKVSIYKIQRNISKRNSTNYQTFSKIESPKHVRVPVRKPRLSGSFKKIGKRKLVRKSLIQNYIISRRQTLPSMIQHSRNTLASRKKLRIISKSKYKLIQGESVGFDKISPLSKLPRYKEKHVIPAKFKLKWNRADSVRIQDFVKLGKNKIVRKSILQSIIEARRSRIYNYRLYSLSKKTCSPKHKEKTNLKTVKSRYKVVRNASTSLHHQSNRSLDCRNRNTTFTINKKIGPVNLLNTLTSKSILYRMPPSLRIRIKLEERRKRTMLLKKINNKKKCLFYNRFGYCRGQDEGTCKKLHDPKSVAVCRKYLKGLCDGNECKLSHQVVPEKMPTCHQFLAGVCVRSACPFQHVKVSGDQPICLDFLQGFCQHGDSCTKRHQFICPEWAEKGSCNSEKCSYPHPSSNKNKNQPAFAPIHNNIAKIDVKGADGSVTITTPADDIRNRYFTDGSEKNESDTLSDNCSVVERKPELKDGVNSVYKNDSLLSFIPFS